MTESSRRELLELLAELGEQLPELRLGQLFTNLATHARGANVEAIWDAEDEELIASARRQLEVLARRNTAGV
jgi:hypothetical protein